MSALALDIACVAGLVASLTEIDREHHDYGATTRWYRAVLGGQEYLVEVSWDSDGPMIDSVGGNKLTQDEAERVTAWARETLQIAFDAEMDV